MKPATVYVIQESDLVIDDAKQFGEIEVLLLGKARDTQAGCDYIDRELRAHFEPQDFLLLLGNPVFIGAAIHAAASVEQVINLLVWDRKFRKYKLEKVSFA